MRNTARIFIFFCFLMGVVTQAENSDPDVVTPLNDALVNWSKGYIAAKGKAEPPEIHQGNQQGRSMAVRQAIGIATKNLYNATQEVQIDAHTRVCDIVAGSEKISHKLKSMVKDAGVVSQKYLTDGTVEVIVQMPLNGGFAQLILPPEIKQIESIKPIQPETVPDTGNHRGQPEDPSKPLTSGQTGDEPSGDTEKNDPPEPYTGIIVDARGLRLKPAMAPRIVDENGTEVFGAEFASREFAVQQGVSGYIKDLAAASSDPRVSDNPMMMKGIKAKGFGQCDIMVSNSEANRLRSNSKHLSVLKKCRVLIVLD